MFNLYTVTFRDQLKQTFRYSGTFLRPEFLELCVIIFNSIKVHVLYEQGYVILCEDNLTEENPCVIMLKFPTCVRISEVR
jgi:hypothetical protein